MATDVDAADALPTMVTAISDSLQVHDFDDVVFFAVDDLDVLIPKVDADDASVFNPYAVNGIPREVLDANGYCVFRQRGPIEIPTLVNVNQRESNHRTMYWFWQLVDDVIENVPAGYVRRVILLILAMYVSVGVFSLDVLHLPDAAHDVNRFANDAADKERVIDRFPEHQLSVQEQVTVRGVMSPGPPAYDDVVCSCVRKAFA